MPSSCRVLITGGDGFVGRYLVRAFKALPQPPEILIGTLGHAGPSEVRSVELDVTDSERVRAIIAAEQPTHVVHLAGIAAVAVAQKDIRKTWNTNFGGVLNVALAIGEAAPDCRLIFCGSAEVYGATFQSGAPLDESAALDPITAYGASKAAADLMIGQMARQGFKGIRLRPFNHTGPGQSDLFVIPAFASQIVRIERGEQEPVLRVGNLSARRDFLDVRDVVDAYVRTVLRFDDLPSGCAINVASGTSVGIDEVLKTLLELSPKKIAVVRDEARYRAIETASMSGNAARAQALLDWRPRIPLAETLRSILQFYREMPKTP